MHSSFEKMSWDNVENQAITALPLEIKPNQGKLVDMLRASVSTSDIWLMKVDPVSLPHNMQETLERCSCIIQVAKCSSMSLFYIFIMKYVCNSQTTNLLTGKAH